MLTKRTKCPSCEKTIFTNIYSLPYNNNRIKGHLFEFYSVQGKPNLDLLNGFDFELLECNNCKLIFQSNIPNYNLLTDLYTVWIDELKVFNKYERFRSIYKINNYNSLLLDVIRYFNRRDLNCFDYGFGYCQLLIQAQILGMNVFGTEINPLQIERAKRIGVSVINLDENIQPKMDVIFCEQVLEHVVDPRKVLENIVKLSKLGTILHISVPDSRFVKHTIKNLNWTEKRNEKYSWMPFQPLEHINCFTHNSLISLLMDFNFKIINIKHGSLLYIDKSSLISVFKFCFWLIKTQLKSLFSQSSRNSTDLYFVYIKDN
jgi:2-polyprenyl-3-methyl-5-hydroxy-6-metoxy-1,4-benzoquinol methylase